MSTNRGSHFRISPDAAWIIAGFALLGVCVSLVSEKISADSHLRLVLQHAGAGLIATAFISFALDIFWTRERMNMERDEMRPVLGKLQRVIGKLDKLESRFEAFKHLGLTHCHPSRSSALGTFYDYAHALVQSECEKPQKPNAGGRSETIDIVSSSSRGLIGYLDREGTSGDEYQEKWRKLIKDYPKFFRLLLTHPAYAYLRQPAELRGSGDIEVEVLKTAIYLHFVTRLSGAQLRFYRGSPTVFLIRVGKHILLNPYPYGKEAMQTLCLEFESTGQKSYVGEFAGMHFDHTWEFFQRDAARVNGHPLVASISSFDDILEAFSECTYSGSSSRLRVTIHQVRELDRFIEIIRSRDNAPPELPKAGAFHEFVQSRGLELSVCNEDDFYSRPTPPV